MGLMWSMLNPLFMLAVYTLVFSVVFKSQWSTGVGETRPQFAIVLFVGLIVHGLFAEVLGRAPGLVIGNVNFVKKVVFPLELLPVISLGAAFFHCLISILVLMVAYLLYNGQLHWTVIFIPLVLLPFLVLILGLAWILASLGVFLRDVGQTMGLILTVAMFASPVFYPIASLPENVRPWFLVNPSTFIIEQFRAVFVFGLLPNWTGLLYYSGVGLMVVWLGYVWFQKTRRGFANVL
jgi:lipopolysaccharide transport system permease protein